MYEETKIKFDWKGFLLKFAILILLLILIIKLLPFENKRVQSESFKENINKLKIAAADYFKTDKLPSKNGDEKTITLEELIVNGKINQLKDQKNGDCDNENSYIKATNNNGEYEIDAFLICNKEEDPVLYLGGILFIIDSVMYFILSYLHSHNGKLFAKGKTIGIIWGIVSCIFAGLMVALFILNYYKNYYSFHFIVLFCYTWFISLSSYLL